MSLPAQGDKSCDDRSAASCSADAAPSQKSRTRSHLFLSRQASMTIPAPPTATDNVFFNSSCTTCVCDFSVSWCSSVVLLVIYRETRGRTRGRPLSQITIFTTHVGRDPRLQTFTIMTPL
ncbi:hypothetical protein NL676_011359 [Syzygium grande]|nr:hypothetical protein NL676_011359 [Syzygium grande]